MQQIHLCDIEAEMLCRAVCVDYETVTVRTPSVSAQPHKDT